MRITFTMESNDALRLLLVLKLAEDAWTEAAEGDDDLAGQAEHHQRAVNARGFYDLIKQQLPAKMRRSDRN